MTSVLIFRFDWRVLVQKI